MRQRCWREQISVYCTFQVWLWAPIRVDFWPESGLLCPIHLRRSLGWYFLILFEGKPQQTFVCNAPKIFVLIIKYLFTNLSPYYNLTLIIDIANIPQTKLSIFSRKFRYCFKWSTGTKQVQDVQNFTPVNFFFQYHLSGENCSYQFYYPSQLPISSNSLSSIYISDRRQMPSQNLQSCRDP